tara:strand:+ start:574 stop:885 length:312 start_codon:yes stop_codon:yes gene_type:complete
MMIKPTYINAIVALDSNAKCLLQNEDLSTLVWEDENPNNITDEQIQDKLVELTAEYEAKEYARKRKAEYPTIEELVVALYDSEDRAAIDAKRAEIKLKYSKGA